MSRFYDGWRPYVSVAQRRANALREMDKLRKQGAVIQPVTIEGRTIARSFWGKGWCTHLESFGDYSNRLPRGRTYVRNGSVCHLGIAQTQVDAIVSGSELYNVRVEITPLGKPQWQALKQQCTGKIGSLIELLQGRLSDEIMAVVTDRRQGLFPQPGEISYRCNCPDWAGMCKHIAAVMYGIGARLDTQPELLFLLRGVDHEELISADTPAGAITAGGSSRSRRRSLSDQDLASVFEVEIEYNPKEPARPRDHKRKPPKKAPARKAAAQKATTKKATTRKTAKKTAATSTPTRHPAKKTTATRAPAPFRPTSAAVARLRRRLAMTKAEFARAVGVSTPTISNWENAGGAIRPNTKGLAGLQRLHQQAR